MRLRNPRKARKALGLPIDELGIVDKVGGQHDDHDEVCVLPPQDRGLWCASEYRRDQGTGPDASLQIIRLCSRNTCGICSECYVIFSHKLSPYMLGFGVQRL